MKQEATRIADALRALHANMKPYPMGPHGQMAGEESYRIINNGFGFEALMDAYYLLQQWPEDQSARIADLERQRDALLEALQGLMDPATNEDGEWYRETRAKARAAIKAAGGGK